MDPTKTRIWNADQLGISAHRSTEQPSLKQSARVLVTPRRGDDTLPAHRQSRSVPPPPPPPRRARASLSPPVSSTLTARWLANANTLGPLASTRIMPIELLLPNGLPALPKSSAASVPITPQPRFRALKRVAGHVLLAALTVLAVALWKLPLRQHVRARFLPPSAADTPLNEHADEREQVAAPDAPHAGPHEVSQPPPTAAADHEVQGSSPAELGDAAPNRDIGSRGERGSRRRQTRVVSLQRQAVELVIGGDFAGAAQAYRVLASEHPDDHAFREAARILAARHGK